MKKTAVIIPFEEIERIEKEKADFESQIKALEEKIADITKHYVETTKESVVVAYYEEIQSVKIVGPSVEDVALSHENLVFWLKLKKCANFNEAFALIDGFVKKIYSVEAAIQQERKIRNVEFISKDQFDKDYVDSEVKKITSKYTAEIEELKQKQVWFESREKMHCERNTKRAEELNQLRYDKERLSGLREDLQYFKDEAESLLLYIENMLKNRTIFDVFSAIKIVKDKLYQFRQKIKTYNGNKTHSNSQFRHGV